ncbi:MAG: thiamine-phosphate kinase [Candidatus Dormibacteria bacterium]
MSSPPPPVRRLFDAGGPTLSEVGEAELLRRLTALALASAAGPPLVVASGDDAAVWLPPAGDGIVLSQDAIVEGEDFLKSWTDPEAVGRRALAVALSDLAAMGAVPHLCMVTYCAPGDAPIDDLLAIQRGLCTAAAAAGCQVAGGDVSAISGPLVIDVAVVGTVAPDRALRRDRGHPTDALLVTGSLGEAAAGLRLLLEGWEVAGEVGERCLERQLEPRARLAEGRALLELGVECAGDLSDGLIVDLGRITEASGCAAEIWLESLPTSPDVRALLGAAWPGAALGGGEDFELVAAVAADRLEGLLAAWPPALQPLRVVGRLATGSGVALLDRQGGEPVPLPAVGSRHFRQP